MQNSKVSILTRKIYHKQHNQIANNRVAMKRFINMIDCKYFGKPKNFFYGKKILDAGCGNTAKLSIRFAQLGASVVACDLGNDFILDAKKSAKRYGVLKKIKFLNASVLKLPFPNSSFDFVCCHGVLLHLKNHKEVTTAFKELSRVTKKNGFLYTVFGVSGGLFEEKIIPSLRDFYRKNYEFKKLIDKINPEILARVFNQAKEISSKKGKRLDLTSKNFKKLFDVDFCVYLQNIIQAPVRLDINEKNIRKMYSQNSFIKIKRLQRFIYRENIRKFTAPLHYLRDNKLLKILYGSGNLEFLANKR